MDRPFFVSRWILCSARHRRVDISNHGLGLMEVFHFNVPLHRRLGVATSRNSVLLCYSSSMTSVISLLWDISSLSTIACPNLISLRQPEITTRR
jgi:hypothetical protein